MKPEESKFSDDFDGMESAEWANTYPLVIKSGWLEDPLSVKVLMETNLYMEMFHCHAWLAEGTYGYLISQTNPVWVISTPESWSIRKGFGV